jgi:hypothetical protein
MRLDRAVCARCSKEDAMSLCSRILTISAVVCLAGPVAVAQYGGAAVAALNGDDAGIVLAQPCVVVEKVVEVTPLADGTKITRMTEERKWRDSQGRFRKEVTQVQEGQEPVFLIATIIDPVKNTITTLHMDTKMASVVHLPEGTLPKYVELDDKELYARPGVQVKVEKLPGKTIAGVYAVGRRVTRTRPPGTIGNDKPVVSVSERWVSPDIKILLATSMDDPREQMTREVTHLERVEPDANLFLVPADFTVKEAQGGPLHQVMISR